MYTSGQSSNHDATTIAKYNFAEYIPEPEVVATSGAPGYEKVNNGLPIRVTFSIDTSVKLKSGKGTYDNPYALDIS